MAKELEIQGRRYWILSDPHGEGWRARVLEVAEGGATEEIGLDASAETRGAADEAAERKLRRMLRAN
jgi:hypothetical protein